MLTFAGGEGAVRFRRPHAPIWANPLRIAPARGPTLWDLPAAGPGDFDPHAQPAFEYELDPRLSW
jgi:hypothetical protein